MPIVHVRHVTTYHYKEAVGFGEHRMMLRPRDDQDQRIIDAELKIIPEPSRLDWEEDAFGNHVATALFSQRASELRFESTISLEHAPSDFRADDIAEFARAYPFSYSAEDIVATGPFIGPRPRHPRLDRWIAGFLGTDGAADTHALLVRITQCIKQTFRHTARHEKGTRDPIQTLELGSGSCRDLAALMIAALRSLGIAARFVSGYLNLAHDGAPHDGAPHDDDPLDGGNTHAWVQAYIPGPGWIDFDPSSGIVGNRDLVRVAVVREPREAIPLQGTWFGPASNFLGMKVAVKVKAGACLTNIATAS